ncbi:MAG: thioredoxin family protein [Oscillospiraceae bacterium]|nr:thioredoxin family protein [Oscillospiraceae bacterium]
MRMKDMNRKNFDKAMQGDRPVLVEFWAPWCVYCRRIIPALEKIAQQNEGVLEIGKINIDDEPKLAAQENIEVIPTLVLYRGGKALGSVVAPESKASIEAFINETLA